MVRVDFLAHGKYLVAASSLSNRFVPYQFINEIYETSSWRMVWSSEDSKLQSVTLTPDGKTMAYVRGTTLVICPFEPKPKFQSATNSKA